MGRLSLFPKVHSPMSSLAPLGPPPCHDKFFDSHNSHFQRKSTELVVWSIEGSQPVIIAWSVIALWRRNMYYIINPYRPTINNKKLTASDIPKWLNACERFWPCFCQFLAEDTLLSSRIHEGPATTVITCHYTEQPRCHFFSE